MKKLFFFFQFLLSLELFAENKTNSNINQKLDFEVSQLSYKYHLEGYPTKKIDDANWVKKDLPHHFRYLHAMLVAAFFSEKAQQSNEARLWLAEYQCENILACKETQSFLDVAMKAYSLILKKTELNLLRKIQNQVDTRVKMFKSQVPKTTGLCAPNADRKNWFELGYEIYCPPFKTITAQGDTNHFTTKSLLKLLEFQSSQIILSSSRVIDFGHDGDIDCDSDWNVQLKCEVGEKEKAYKLICNRSSVNSKVNCSEVK